jgi:hypothetical protein
MPVDPGAFELERILASLDRHGVEYILVGGLGARAHGATRPTMDLEFVPLSTSENLDRLADGLRELDARLRVAGMTDEEARQLPVVIDAATLRGFGSTTWRTDAGSIDVLHDVPTATWPPLPTSSTASNMPTGPRTMRPCPNCTHHAAASLAPSSAENNRRPPQHTRGDGRSSIHREYSNFTSVRDAERCRDRAGALAADRLGNVGVDVHPHVDRRVAELLLDDLGVHASL